MQIYSGAAVVLKNDECAENTYFLRLRTTEPFPQSLPGQFVMLRFEQGSDPLLGRPFAVYKHNGDVMDIVYLAVGKMTKRLSAARTGEKLLLWGPLGNGFDAVLPDTCNQHYTKDVLNFSIANTESPQRRAHTEQAEQPSIPTSVYLCVAGGIGHTPFYSFAQDNDITLLYGAKTQAKISCIDDFRALGANVQIATEDGSIGHKGFVTDLIDANISDATAAILACGPLPMLRAVFGKAKALSLPCFVSLETPMSCGLGICYGCVVPSSDAPESEEFDYKRTCVDGPIFDAYRLKWSD